MGVFLVAISMSCSMFGMDLGAESGILCKIESYIPVLPIISSPYTIPKLKARLLASLVVPAVVVGAGVAAAHYTGFTFPQDHPFYSAAAVAGSAAVSYALTNNFTVDKQLARNIKNEAKLNLRWAELEKNARTVGVDDLGNLVTADPAQREEALVAMFRKEIGKNHPYPNAVLQPELDRLIGEIGTEIERKHSINQHRDELVKIEETLNPEVLKNRQAVLQRLYDNLVAQAMSDTHGIKYARLQAALSGLNAVRFALGTITISFLSLVLVYLANTNQACITLSK